MESHTCSVPHQCRLAAHQHIPPPNNRKITAVYKPSSPPLTDPVSHSHTPIQKLHQQPTVLCSGVRPHTTAPLARLACTLVCIASSLGNKKHLDWWPHGCTAPMCCHHHTVLLINTHKHQLTPLHQPTQLQPCPQCWASRLVAAAAGRSAGGMSPRSG